MSEGLSKQMCVCACHMDGNERCLACCPMANLEAEVARLRAEVAEVRRDFQTRDEQLTVARLETRKAEAERDAAIRERDEARTEAKKWQRIRNPTHGPCCTCQRCGKAYEDCRCDLDEVCDELDTLKAESAALRARLEKARAEVARIVAIVEPRHLDGISPGTAAEILYPARAFLAADPKEGAK